MQRYKLSHYLYVVFLEKFLIIRTVPPSCESLNLIKGYARHGGRPLFVIVPIFILTAHESFAKSNFFVNFPFMMISKHSRIR